MREERYGLTLVTPPSAEPVTVAEAKAWSRVEHSADDDWFEEEITAARELAEAEWDRTFVTTTWKATWREWPCGTGGIIRLPRGPLVSVTSIKYLDLAGVLQTWSSAEYVVVTSRDPGEVWLADGSSWPATHARHPEAVQVTYVAGYGAAASVPRRARAAIKASVAYLYAHRGDDDSEGMPEAINRLLRSMWNGTV